MLLIAGGIGMIQNILIKDLCGLREVRRTDLRRKTHRMCCAGWGDVFDVLSGAY